MVGKKKQMNQDEDMEINLPATSSEDHIGDVETLQQTLDRSEGESIWNTDVEFNPELADETLGQLAARAEQREGCAAALPFYERLREQYSRSGWAAVARSAIERCR